MKGIESPLLQWPRLRVLIYHTLPFALTLSLVFGVSLLQPYSPVARAARVTVAIKDFLFLPAVITISVGDTVTWINEDGVPHTATSTSAPSAFDTGVLTFGQSASVTFNVPGIYNYKCVPHPFATGQVIVQQARAPVITPTPVRPTPKPAPVIVATGTLTPVPIDTPATTATEPSTATEEPAVTNTPTLPTATPTTAAMATTPIAAGSIPVSPTPSKPLPSEPPVGSSDFPISIVLGVVITLGVLGTAGFLFQRNRSGNH